MEGRGDGFRVEFGILGPLRVLVDGTERPVAGDKLQALLARLLLEPNRTVSTDSLIDDLWGDDVPATARQSLHAHVTRLRRALAVDDSGTLLDNDGRGYVLRVDPAQIDATRFRSLLADARDARRAGQTREARATYADALAVWRGPAFDGVPLDRADTDRAELDALRSAALEERIDIDLELGAAAELIPELERLVHVDPVRERPWAQLMLALYASGRQADALAAYQEARHALGELGLEPGPALRDLEQAILNQDPSLVTMPPPSAAGSAAPARGRRLVAVAALVVAAVVVAGVVVLARDEAPNAADAAVVTPDSLVEIDPAGNRVVSVTPVGHGPESIAATDDAIWVASFEDRTVTRVDLETKNVRNIGGAPVALQVASSLSGDVWVSSFEEPYVTLIASEGKLDTSVYDLAAGRQRVELPGSAEALAIGGGSLWVTSPSDSGGNDTVSRIDLRTRKVVSSVPVGTLPLYAAFGYGSAWVANYKGDSVSVISPGSDVAENVEVSGGPLGVATGAGGVWVVVYWSRELVRIDPETRRVRARIPVGDGPLAVAVGAGSVWVTNRSSSTITRIDPSTDKVVATIPLAASPWGIEFAHGRVWVATQRAGMP